MLTLGLVGFQVWVRQQAMRGLRPAERARLQRLVLERLRNEERHSRSPACASLTRRAVLTWLRSLELGAVAAGVATVELPLRIRGVVADYERLTAALSRPQCDLAQVRSELADRLGSIHLAVAATSASEPKPCPVDEGRMTGRTRRAYAGLRELAEPGRLVSLATTAGELRERIESLRRRAGDRRRLRLALRRTTGLWRWRGYEDEIDLTISSDVAAAPSASLEALARWCVLGDASGRTVVESWVSGRRRASSSAATKGLAYDLGTLLAELENPLTLGQSRARLTWSEHPRARELGHYRPYEDTIELSALLDHPAIPRRVVSFVLHHELVHRARIDEGGGLAHDGSFHRREARFIGYEDVCADLDRLTASLRAGGDLRSCRWRSA